MKNNNQLENGHKGRTNLWQGTYKQCKFYQLGCTFPYIIHLLISIIKVWHLFPGTNILELADPGGRGLYNIIGYDQDGKMEIHTWQ